MTKTISKPDTLPVWYPPNEINYHPVQMELFLIPNIFDLRQGDYPVQPSAYRKYESIQVEYEDGIKVKVWEWHAFEKSPYAEAGGTGFQPNGKFVKAVEHAAEIDDRINSIGTVKVKLASGYTITITGFLLFDIYRDQIDIKDNEIIREAAKMLEYISGWKRKGKSYEDFRGQPWR